MAIAPPRLCGCGRIVKGGERCTCQKVARIERNRRFERTRPSAAERGYDSAWQKATKGFVKKHPVCVLCKGVATCTDHIIPHRGDKRLFWDRNNWQPLCKPCHDRHKQRQERQA